MIRFVLRRLLAIVPTLLIASLIVFALLRLAPGDPAALVVGDLGDSARVAQVRAELGLDRPIAIQYLIWLGHILQGDFGSSFMTEQPVLPALLDHFLVTVQVVGLAFLLSSLIAIPAGMYAAARRNRSADLSIVATATVLVSIPSFWAGMMLVLVFGAMLGWLPTLGFVAITENPAEWARHVVLPVTALVLVETGVLIRLIRATTLHELGQDYVDYARAKGLGERRILSVHVLRNALAPLLPLMGLILSSLLSGTAVIETVFGIPGLGRFLVDAIYARDYPVIQGVLLFTVLIYALVNVAVDLIHPLLDPRVRPA